MQSNVQKQIYHPARLEFSGGEASVGINRRERMPDGRDGNRSQS